jgi:hypothetical protein
MQQYMIKGSFVRCRGWRLSFEGCEEKKMRIEELSQECIPSKKLY